MSPRPTPTPGAERRRFLKGAGAVVASMPFLRALPASAATAFPKRLVIFCAPNGTIYRNWATGGTYGRILQPLEPLRQKISIVRGLTMESAYVMPVPPDHGPDFANLLTARQAYGPNGAWQLGGISIDQHIAEAVRGPTKFASLQLGVQGSSYAGVVSARGRGMNNPPDNSATSVYRRLFAELPAGMAPVTGAPAGPEADALARLRRRRKSVLDLVARQVTALECQLPLEDRPKFQAHLTAVRELESTLDKGAATAGNPAAVPSACKAPPEASNSTYPIKLKSQLDNIVAAFTCDLTRVVTLQLSHGSSGVRHSWVDPSITGSHHGIAHNSEGVNAPTATREEWLTLIEAWTAKQFLYLIDKMDRIQEGAGTMLDNSLVVWAHEQADGFSHSRKDMPWVLAGGCGGALKTGQALTINDAHNQLLITFAEAMGVPTKAFGDEKFSKGPLSQLLA